MPNHITNKIQIIIDDNETYKQLIESFFRSIAGVPDEEEEESNVIDFNKLIAQPDDIIQGDLSLEMCKQDNSWYAWNTKNWGTKWNAYFTSLRVERLRDNKICFTLKFRTAWSAPWPIITRFPVALRDYISRPYENMILWYGYSDEDWYYTNQGFLVYDFDADQWIEDHTKTRVQLIAFANDISEEEVEKEMQADKE